MKDEQYIPTLQAHLDGDDQDYIELTLSKFEVGLILSAIRDSSSISGESAKSALRYIANKITGVK